MIKILLFAHLQEYFGKNELEINTEFPLTISELKEILQRDYSFPDLKAVMIAVNEEYALADMLVNSGDTVALIPPVSGG